MAREQVVKMVILLGSRTYEEGLRRFAGQVKRSR